MSLVPAVIEWKSNHMPSKVWDEITYPFLNFNGCTIEVWEWISNFILHIIIDVITNPCWNLCWTLLVIRAPGNIAGDVIILRLYNCLQHHHDDLVRYGWVACDHGWNASGADVVQTYHDIQVSDGRHHKNIVVVSCVIWLRWVITKVLFWRWGWETYASVNWTITRTNNIPVNSLRPSDPYMRR